MAVGGRHQRDGRRFGGFDETTHFAKGDPMSLDRSLKSASSLVRHRNVLKRDERLTKLKEDEKWTEAKSVFGLPKVAHRKAAVAAKAAKEEDAEGAVAGAAAPAAGAAAGAKPAAGAKGAAGAKPAAAPAAKGGKAAAPAAAPAKGKK
jgi:small basic protein (TIGR04137 family)